MKAHKFVEDFGIERAKAILEVDRLAQELYSAKLENNKLRNSSQALIDQLELLREQNKKHGNSQKVFALQFCIHEIKKAMGEV